MKKYVAVILLLLIIISGIIFCYAFFRENIELIDTRSEKVCSTSKLKEYSDYNIYSYCLDKISIITNKEEYSITDFLNRHNFEDILDLFEKYSVAYDGGSIIYMPSNQTILKNESILIIDCNNKQFNNNNIYIIPEDNEIGIKICQQNSY